MSARSDVPLPLTRLGPATRCVDIGACARRAGFDARLLPRPLLILLENVLVHEGADPRDLAPFAAWLSGHAEEGEIPFRPGRILSHDTAGIAMLVDLAALRDRMAAQGRDPSLVTSAVPIDLVVDHSVAADVTGTATARQENDRLEIERNRERYRFLRWAESAFGNLRLIPPGNGICHQVNVEFLAQGVLPSPKHDGVVSADTVIGTDSHTTMVNALGILGWGVGGIEAEAVALGQPQIMSLPPVTGCRLTGRRRRSISGADIALSVMNALRQHGVVGRFVEFFGEGLDELLMGDRASLANMAPEYGATCGLFPIDHETLRYLRETGRAEAQIELIAAHAHAIGLWRDDSHVPLFTDTLTIDLGAIEPVVAGPRRPQEKVALSGTATSFKTAFPGESATPPDGALNNGDIVIAAISSCTHTSNAQQMAAAGLLARKARRLGLKPKPWVKTSLSPGSRIIERLYDAAGLQDDLDALGFQIAGFGCMTCAGNPGQLAPEISTQIKDRDLVVCSFISGNRNFEGRTHPDVRASYIGSPALVIAYALAGTMLTDISSDPLGHAPDGTPVRLDDLWPTDEEVADLLRAHLVPGFYHAAYAPESLASDLWLGIEAPQGDLFAWQDSSTHVRRPPFFETAGQVGLADILGARPLAVLGDNITTDHISPFGRILPGSAAAEHLSARGVGERDWSSYAEHRGNHEVLLRGTFSNPRIRNALAQGRTGSLTTGPSGEVQTIMAAAEAYQAEGTPTVVFAGKAYGTGSARDWAAKGTFLIGVKAVVAESFERIHRANLTGVGVVPCQLPAGVTVDSLGVGPETRVTIEGLAGLNGPRATVRMVLTDPDGGTRTIPLTCRIDTETELAQFRQGGLFASSEEAVRARSATADAL